MKCNRRAAIATAVCLPAALWLVPYHGALAQAVAQYKVGDRVAAPIGAQYFDAVVLALNINVNGVALTYLVHPIGFDTQSEFTAFPQMLRPWGSVQMEPWGGYAADPYEAEAAALPPGSPLRVPAP